jgi:hypothetical protein
MRYDRERFRLSSIQTSRAGKCSPPRGECSPAAASGSSQHSCTATSGREPTSNQNRRAGAAGGQGRARQTEDRAVSKPVPRERKCLRSAMGQCRWPARIYTDGRKGLEGHQQKPPGGSKESRPEDPEIPSADRRRASIRRSTKSLIAYQRGLAANGRASSAQSVKHGKPSGFPGRNPNTCGPAM